MYRARAGKGANEGSHSGPATLASGLEWFEVHMKTSLSAGWDRPEIPRHNRAARTVEEASLVADGEAAHGRA